MVRLLGIKIKKSYYLFGYLRIEKELKFVFNNLNLMCFKYLIFEKVINNFNESCKFGVGGYGEVFKVVVFFFIYIYFCL